MEDSRERDAVTGLAWAAIALICLGGGLFLGFAKPAADAPDGPWARVAFGGFVIAAALAIRAGVLPNLRKTD